VTSKESSEVVVAAAGFISGRCDRVNPKHIGVAAAARKAAIAIVTLSNGEPVTQAYTGGPSFSEARHAGFTAR
jgi:hypothetical protein